MAGDLDVGSVVAGYRIEGMAGRGGMGVVYVAEHVHLGRRVALKVLAPELAADASFRERFIRESRLAAQIEHPNAIPVYDAGEADGVLYIAMRLVEGTDLRKVLDREGALPPERTLGILDAVAGALDAAHEDGLIHRDVKPPNILLEPGRGGGEHVFLTDFGLTKRVGSEGPTRTGTMVGTLHYMAPEQIQGGALDGRVDQYALGCVLFECLTGSVPYPRDSDVSVMYAHLEEPPPPVSTLRPDLPAAVDAVVLRAMAKSPDDRYASCGAMVAAARDALGVGGGQDAAPSSPRAGRDATVAAPPPTPAVPTAIRSSVRKTPADTPLPPARGERRFNPFAVVAIVVVVLALVGTTVAVLTSGSKQPGGQTGPTGVPSGATPTGGPSVVPSGGTPTGSPATSPSAVPGVTNGRIAFIDNNNVVSVLPDGTGRTSITTSADRELTDVDTGAVWSPDGTMVAIVRQTVAGASPIPLTTLVVVPVDASGTPGEQFVPAKLTGVRNVAWSPDSGTLAATFATVGARRDRVMAFPAAPDSTLSQLGSAAPGSPVAFTSQGNFLAFVEQQPDRILEVALSLDARAVVAPEAEQPCCPQPAPIGERVALIAEVDGVSQLGIGRPIARNFTPISDGQASRASLPRWSPDGTRLVFVSDRTGDDDVWVVNADGTGLQDLTADSTKADTEPVWSPDGTQIAFTSKRDGHRQVYVMNADGTDSVNISASAFDASAPSWQIGPSS